MLHVGPVNPGEQVHVHAVLPTFDVTDAAWLLQCVDAVHTTVFATSIVTEKVGAVVTYWPTAVPVGVRVTTFVLGVTDVVVTEIVFAVASPDSHLRNVGL